MPSYIKVSIIVPIYKVPEPFLRRCIENCTNQTLKEIEIILVDDGSPDNCGEICDEYAQQDLRIKVIHKENGGLATARNSGQDIASGETMMFLDGDDYLEPSCCEKAYDALTGNNVELVMFDQITDYPNSKRIVHSFNDEKGSRIFENDGCRELQARVLDFNGKIAMAFMKLIRLDFIKKHNIRHIDELSQGAEGFVFNIQLFEYARKVYYLNEPLLHYVYNGQSISHSSSVRNNILIVRCMEWIDQFITDCGHRTQLHPLVLNRLLYVICTTAITGCFSPSNEQSHKERIASFENFMREPIVRESLFYAPRNGVNKQRRIILMLIKFRLYHAVEILGWLRKKQLENR